MGGIQKMNLVDSCASTLGLIDVMATRTSLGAESGRELLWFDTPKCDIRENLKNHIWRYQTTATPARTGYQILNNTTDLRKFT